MCLNCRGKNKFISDCFENAWKKKIFLKTLMHAILKRKKMPLFILFSIMKSIAILDMYCMPVALHPVQPWQIRFLCWVWDFLGNSVYKRQFFSFTVCLSSVSCPVSQKLTYLPRGSVRNDGNGCLCWSSCCYGSAYLTLPFSRQDPAPPQTCWLPGGGIHTHKFGSLPWGSIHAQELCLGVDLQHWELFLKYPYYL